MSESWVPQPYRPARAAHAAHPSVGARALALVLDQAAWTHRRVDSLAFHPSGETTRRISWDLTVPGELAIPAGEGRVAVPLTTMTKRPLKRLDVRDGSGAALPLWGRQQNGELGALLLEAGVAGVVGAPLPGDVRETVEEIVVSANQTTAGPAIARLHAWVDDQLGVETEQRVLVGTLSALLADAFLFVVELPADRVGVRTLVKVSYDDDQLLLPGAWHTELMGSSRVLVDARGWADAATWHLEVHAPEGLRVRELRYEVWERGGEHPVRAGGDGPDVSTAHVTGPRLDPAQLALTEVDFGPSRHGLLNHVLVGALSAFVVLAAATTAAPSLARLLNDPDGGAGVAALALGVPAFLLALISRASEHELVARVLTGPRIVSFASAVVLAVAGVVMLWSPDADTLARELLLLTVLQGGLLAWVTTIRAVSS